MANATLNAAPTIRAEEAAHFGRMAAQWWDPKGSSAMLHRLNPVRLSFLREAVDRHWHGDSRGLKPLAGKRALDVGCGAGLLCEPLARLGADVVGIDAAPENITVAKAHAAGQGLVIDYRATGVEALGMSGRFDLVTSMEVIEHVTDPVLFVRGLADALAPGGLMILSTPNRTPLSRLAMISVGEGLGLIPKGTHDWSQFLTPDELTDMLADVGLKSLNMRGISFDPRTGFVLNDDTKLNYILCASPK